MRRWHGIVAAGLMSLAAPAWSESAGGADGTAGAPTRLEEVVVTGSKTSESQWEATVPTQVVPRTRVEETATVNIENVLAEIPGLYVRRNEQFGLGASTLRMQGADPNKVAVLVDGRRFRGGVDGVVDLRDIPANNVERIEVLRGPASSLYGSDAMAGVINIITRAGSPEPRASVGAASGSFARRLYTASHGYAVGPVRYFLSGSHDEFRLAEQFGAVSRQFAGANADETQDRDQVSLRLDADLGPAHTLTFAPAFQQETNPTSQNRNLTTAAEWQWQTGPGSRLTTWVNRYGFTRRNDLTGFEEDVGYTDWEGESHYALELGPGRWWASDLVTGGVRARRQSLDRAATTIRGATGALQQPAVQASVWQLSPFVQADLLLSERWSLLVGSSFDVHERYGLDVNPRATLTWRPSSVLRLSASGGRGFRAPDLRQLFDLDVNLGGLYALLGNPGLQPETDLALNLEADVRARGIDGFASLFRHDFQDLIAFAQVPVCIAPGRPPGCIVDPLPQLPSKLRFQTRNFAAALTEGAEVGIEVSPLELLDVTSPHALGLGLGYGFLHTVNRDGIRGEDGNALPFRPPHRVLPSVDYRYAPLGLGLKVWGEWEDATFTDVANSRDLVARKHWLWNFKVSAAPLKLLPAGEPRALARALGIGRHLRVFVQGENVFDTEFGPVTPSGRLAGPASFLFGIAAEY